MANSIDEYHVSRRYLHAKTKHSLTVRYIGPLPPAPGHLLDASLGASGSSSSPQVWLGVEYDDPSHGRGHSGTYEEFQVFQCRREGAGAFIKLAPGVLIPGRTLFSALEERYGAIVPDGEIAASKARDSMEESIRLGSSGIVVEAPGMSAVRKKIGRLEKLREVGLEGEWISNLGGDWETRRRMRERLKGQSEP